MHRWTDGQTDGWPLWERAAGQTQHLCTDAVLGNREGLRSRRKTTGCEEGRTDGRMDSASPTWPRFCCPSALLAGAASWFSSCHIPVLPVPRPSAPNASSQHSQCLIPLLLVLVARSWPCAAPDWTGRHRSPSTAAPGRGQVQGGGCPGWALPGHPKIHPQGLPGRRAAPSPSAAPRSRAAAACPPQPTASPSPISPLTSIFLLAGRLQDGTRCQLQPPAQHRTQPAQPTGGGTDPDPQNISQRLQGWGFQVGGGAFLPPLPPLPPEPGPARQRATPAPTGCSS